MLTPVDMPGADCGDIASVSSKKGFVERGRSGRFDETDPATEGERARFRKGLLEPKLAAVGEAWCSVGRRDALNQLQVLKKMENLDQKVQGRCHFKDQGVQPSPAVTHKIQSSGEVLQVTYLAGPARCQAHNQALEWHSL